MNLCIGQLVKSTAGHDKGQYFLVYQIIDDNYVKIVDGRRRKLEKPKMKKIKHLSKINKKSDIINTIDTRDLQRYNKQISREITSLLEIK